MTVPNEDLGLTNAELRDKYLHLARLNERRAEARKQRVRDMVRRELINRYGHKRSMTPQEFEARVDDVTNQRVAGSSNTPGDPTWKGLVALNQWYTNYATMYGTAAISDDVRSLTVALEALMQHLRRNEDEATT